MPEIADVEHQKVRRVHSAIGIGALHNACHDPAVAFGSQVKAAVEPAKKAALLVLSLRFASRGDRPSCAIKRSTFSTTTMASSTRMPRRGINPTENVPLLEQVAVLEHALDHDSRNTRPYFRYSRWRESTSKLVGDRRRLQRDGVCADACRGAFWWGRQRARWSGGVVIPALVRSPSGAHSSQRNCAALRELWSVHINGNGPRRAARQWEDSRFTVASYER